MTQEVRKWADEAMFTAPPLVDGEELLKPRVTLTHMTPDPLRVMAVAAGQYEGKSFHSPDDISRDYAMHVLSNAAKSLSAPLEFVVLHLYFEGVTRSFTHQLVRQRTATYVQESMRFAVKENAAHEVVMPPSIQALADDHPMRQIWMDHVARTAWVYNSLVNGGIPAEDARGGLLINIGTRVHYRTNLRDLIQHAGLRLCSQAQAEWKEVWAGIIREIMAYGPIQDAWQQREIVKLFRPVCYNTGKCEFMATTDRWCVIRERVEAHHSRGEPPDTWTDINPRECLHVEAARRT
jgi:flavin-dependent thymidylate synthase